MLLFWKLVLIIKMSTSQNFKTIFKYNLTCIFLSLRAKLKKNTLPRTPCIYAISYCIIQSQSKGDFDLLAAYMRSEAGQIVILL